MLKQKLRGMTFIAVMAMLVLALNSQSALAANQRITVLVSSDHAPFEQALTGFQQSLSKQGVEVDYDIYPLDTSRDETIQAIRKMREEKPLLILTLGSFAAEAALHEFHDIPILVCVVLKKDSLDKASNATGVVLEFPSDTQFEWLLRFLPNARTVGVIYNPDENDSRIETAASAARQKGLSLQRGLVKNPKDFPSSLKTASHQADVLWGVSDTMVLNPQTARKVLLYSFRNRIPFIGLSQSWTKAGALYSLDWDYTDMGEQCGEMASRILRGTPVKTIPPVSPRKVNYTINLKTARHMKMEISDKLIQGAQHVFR